MKEICLVILFTFTFLILSVLNLTSVNAEQMLGPKKDLRAKPQKEPEWELHAGITRSWPSQKAANDYVHVIEDQMRQVAQGVRRFEDWNDVYTGTVSIGIGKKSKIPLWRKSIPVKHVASFSYGNGDINTRQSNLPSFFGVPMTYHFNQEYTFYRLEGGIEVDVFNMGPISSVVAGYISYNWFESDTHLDVNLDPVESQTLRGRFKKSDFGYTAAFFIRYRLPVGSGWSILTAFRYDWLNMKDDTDITQVQSSPLGSTSTRYAMPFEVDLTGPVAGMFINKEF